MPLLFKKKYFWQSQEEAAKDRLIELLPELEQLSRQLQGLPNPDVALYVGLARYGLETYFEYVAEGAIYQLVRFFSYISPWHDRLAEIDDIIRGLADGNHYNRVLMNLRILRPHFVNAGRERYGWNRSRPGEQVTPDNVYLGNVYGLWTFTARSWHEGASPDEPRMHEWAVTTHEEMIRGMNSRDVVERQARNFMEGHIGPICAAIARIVEAVAPK